MSLTGQVVIDEQGFLTDLAVMDRYIALLEKTKEHIEKPLEALAFRNHMYDVSRLPLTKRTTHADLLITAGLMSREEFNDLMAERNPDGEIAEWAKQPEDPTGNSSSHLYVEKSEMNSLGLTTTRLADFMEAGPTEIAWCINDILPADGVGILGGYSGWGKTFVLLDLGIDVALGRPWLGRFATQKGKVLFIDEESSAPLVRKRMKKLLAGKSLAAGDVDIHLAIREGLCFNDQASEAKLRQTLAQLRPSLVIIDALIRVFRGEENSATDMRNVFAIVKGILKDFPCSILFADHQGKQAPGVVAQGPRDVRGSSEKRAFVDVLLSMDKKEDTIFVEHSKSRCGMEVSPFALKIEDNAENTATFVRYIGEAGPLKQATKLGPALDLLTDQFNTKPGQYRTELVEAGKSAGISERVIDEALKALVRDGRIEKEMKSPDNGPGGKRAFYNLKQGLPNDAPNNSFHFGRPIGEKKNSASIPPADFPDLLGQIQTVFPGAKVREVANNGTI